MDLSTTLLTIVAVVVLRWIINKVTQLKYPLASLAGPKSDHWLKGNLGSLYQNGLEYNLVLQEKYGGIVKVHGMLGADTLYVSDPRAITEIIIKEQDVFEETDMFIVANKLIFGEGLISTTGAQHTKQRKMLTPVFSRQNMHDLLPTIQPIATRIASSISSQISSEETKEIDMLPWMSRGALEYVCQATLGYSFNALDADHHNDFAEAIRHLAPAALKLIFIRPLVPAIVKNISLYWRNKMIDWLPIKPLKELRTLSKIMESTSRRIFEEKKAHSGKVVDFSSEEASEGHVNVNGKDILSILIRANEMSSETERLSEAEVLGQMSTIIFAGFDNTANAICRLLWILSRVPEVQTILRSEIRKAKLDYGGLGESSAGWEDVNLPYDVLMGLPYLDAIVRETLRVFPPTSILTRKTKSATTLPLAKPIQSASGSTISSVAVPANTQILISIISANFNKDVWGEDAQFWRPNRWLTGELKGTKPEDLPELEMQSDKKEGSKYPGVYGSMMTFLGGGRSCIAFKFAEMEIKQVVSTLLSTMHFSLPSSLDKDGNKKEIYWKYDGIQVPIVLPPRGDGVTPQVPLDVRRVREEDFAYAQST